MIRIVLFIHIAVRVGLCHKLEINETDLAEDEGGAPPHKILDVCVMVGTAVLAVVLSPLVPLYFLYEAVFERDAPDYSHMNGHAHAIH